MSDEEDDDSMPAQDSFIDVVCNMVGVLIILVLLVGMRGSEVIAPRLLASASAEAAVAAAVASEDVGDHRRDELDAATRAAVEAEQEIQAAMVQAVDLRLQAELTDARRQQLSVVQAAVEQDIAERRAQLDGQGQRQFDVQRDIVAAEIRLHDLTQRQVSLMADAAEIEEVECVPTPMAKTVDGEEIHVRLRSKQLAVVPVDQLLEEVRRRGGDYLRSGLSSRNEAVDVYGPIDGFRMQLSVERHETSLPGESPLAGPPRMSVLLQGVFMPTSENLGQPVEQALLPTSSFMQTLRSKRAASPTVTAWVYPDSYGELRTLKRALWEADIPLAVRPLNHGQAIIFSTAGSKSAAQ